jgi:hypothetical protein
MRAGKQLSIMLANKPGELSNVCKKLARAKVNIRAVSVAEATEQGVVRMVVDKTGTARTVLKKAGLPYVTSDVVLLEMANKPGMLADVAAKLARQKINLNYVYGSTGPGAQNAIVVLGVDDVAAAKKLLA